MSLRNLNALLTPESVVLVGASNRLGSVGGTIARNLLRGGFKGRMDFVDPHHREIEGESCAARDRRAATRARSCGDRYPRPYGAGHRWRACTAWDARCRRRHRWIRRGIDQRHARGRSAASVPRARTQWHRPDLAAHWSRRELLRTARRRPATLHSYLDAVSVTSVIDWAVDRGIGFSHVVSLGNMADVDFGDLLDYLAGDPGCRAILALHQIRHARAEVHVGGTTCGSIETRRRHQIRPACRSHTCRSLHTGRMAGADAAYDAAFRRAGMLRVYDLPELFEAAEILTRVPRLASEKLVIMTNGGGAGVLAADRLGDFGGQLAELSPETMAALDKVLAATWSKGNPVDIIGDAGTERTEKALDILLAAPDPASVLIINCPTALTSSTDIAEITVAAVERHRKRTLQPKPILTNWLAGMSSAAEARRLFASHRIATFDTPDAAARGLMHLVRYSARSERFGSARRRPWARPRSI